MPTMANPKITTPIGIPECPLCSSVKVGISRGGGGVKVGSRVGVPGSAKAAARVGSMVGVVRGVGVGGGSTMGRKPGESETRGA